MSDLPAYLPLNPFVDLSVGEAELWGTRTWVDVPQIHAAQAMQLRTAVELVRANRRTQVRFVRGVGGSGKSHLFARLRRELGDSILYAYAPNPPLQPETLEAFLLNKIVTSLRQKARTSDGRAAPYSQLRLLAYALLRPAIAQGDLPIEQLHEAWTTITLEEQKNLLHTAMLMIEGDHPMVARGVLRCLLTVLREDKENLAGQWLAGTGYLTEADLKFLGEPEAMGPDLHGPTIHLLGKLAGMAQRPFVLVLDQLDLVTSQPQLDEFQRLLFALIDQSENWSVFIGLVGERFTFWEQNINQALRGRVGVPSPSQPDKNSLPVIDVSPIVAADKEVLIKQRLLSPSLVRQREADEIESALHPLTEADLKLLTSGGAVYARHLLAACSERYTQSVITGGQAARVPLADKIDALLEEASDAARGEAAGVSALELGERVRELIDVLSEPPPTLKQGPLREQVPAFDGTDHIFESEGRRARIAATDATRRPLIAVLEHLQNETGNTLLLRSAAAGISGQVTLELFRQFKARNHFHHISPTEASMLVALGSVLASLREGNYDQLLTEPPATQENIMTALRESGRLRALRVWQAVQATFAAKPLAVIPPSRSPSGRVQIPARVLVAAGDTEPVIQPIQPVLIERPIAPNVEKLSQHCVETVQVLLKMERWMELRRLHRRLNELGCSCSLDSLRLSLRSAPLSASTMLHPPVAVEGGGPQIVLWHETA